MLFELARTCSNLLELAHQSQMSNILQALQNRDVARTCSNLLELSHRFFREREISEFKIGWAELGISASVSRLFPPHYKQLTSSQRERIFFTHQESGG
jgi:hypothetical protein